MRLKHPSNRLERKPPILTRSHLGPILARRGTSASGKPGERRRIRRQGEKGGAERQTGRQKGDSEREGEEGIGKEMERECVCEREGREN